MRERPEDLDERELPHALKEWGIEVASLTYSPVGFGDYHWSVTGADGRRWFVTVADLDAKPYCGVGADAAAVGLRQRMDAAAGLLEGGLGFVVAPLRAARGETTRRIGHRYALSVFPYVEGTASEYSQEFSAEERGRVIDMLAELHRAVPPDPAPVAGVELPLRDRLEVSLTETGQPWRGGPFAEPARELVAGYADTLRRQLAEFDRNAAEVRRRLRAVVTHGEPHPGNLLRAGERLLLIDWDTMGLAAPERDLWSVATGADDLARYADASGRVPDPSALALYRLRWDLDEVALYVDLFRSAHARTFDTGLAWDGFRESLERLARYRDG